MSACASARLRVLCDYKWQWQLKFGGGEAKTYATVAVEDENRSTCEDEPWDPSNVGLKLWQLGGENIGSSSVLDVIERLVPPAPAAARHAETPGAAYTEIAFGIIHNSSYSEKSPKASWHQRPLTSELHLLLWPESTATCDINSLVDTQWCRYQAKRQVVTIVCSFEQQRN